MDPEQEIVSPLRDDKSTVPKVNRLMPQLVAGDFSAIRSIIIGLDSSPINVHSILSERCSGAGNIFHACVTVCKTVGGKNAEVEDDLSSVPDWHASTEDSMDTTSPLSEPSEQRINSLACLKALGNSSVLRPHLKSLMSAVDAQGRTPFMKAVAIHSYAAALILMDLASQFATQYSRTRRCFQKMMERFIFPVSSSFDSSPLFVLCSWTSKNNTGKLNCVC